MTKNSGDGIIFNGGLAILMVVACFSFGGQLNQTAPKPTKESSTAPVPKYSRDWTTVVQKMMMSSDPAMVKIAKANGLLVSIEKSSDRTDFEFDDPVTHESVLTVNQIECSFPVPARAEQSSIRAAPK